MLTTCRGCDRDVYVEAASCALGDWEPDLRRGGGERGIMRPD